MDRAELVCRRRRHRGAAAGSFIPLSARSGKAISKLPRQREPVHINRESSGKRAASARAGKSERKRHARGKSARPGAPRGELRVRVKTARDEGISLSKCHGEIRFPADWSFLLESLRLLRCNFTFQYNNKRKIVKRYKNFSTSNTRI